MKTLCPPPHYGGLRVGPVSERIWNPDAGRTSDDVRRRFASTDALLTKLIAGIPLDDGRKKPD